MEQELEEIKKGKNYQALLAGWKKHLVDMDSICALLMGRRGLVDNFIKQFEEFQVEKYGRKKYTEDSINILRNDLEEVVIEVYGPDL